MNPMRGVTVNTSIVGHGVRNGVVQGGAVALMLGAVLAASGTARAAESFSPTDGAGAAQAEADFARITAREDAEMEHRFAQAEVEAERREAQREAQREAEAARKEAQREAEATRREAQREADEARREAELAKLDEKLEAAQERLQEAAQEVAQLSQARAQDAMGQMNWMGVWSGNPRPVLGLQLDPEPDDSKDGTRIEDVSPGGPAEQAGVRAGDVIVMVNGKDVKKQKTREVLQELRAVNVKKPVKLRVLRDGKPMDFDVTPRIVSAQVLVPPSAPIPPVPPMPNMESFKQFERFGFNYNFGGRNELSGLEVTALTPQLGRYFGTDKGMLVLRAPKGELIKLQEGDVIVSIDGRVPTSGSHISRILSSYQPGEKLTLRILRDRKEQDLTVTLPEDARRAAARDRQRDRSSSTDEL
jgi:C-terminal processing protease CtpA/Prc